MVASFFRTWFIGYAKVVLVKSSSEVSRLQLPVTRNDKQKQYHALGSKHMGGGQLVCDG